MTNDVEYLFRSLFAISYLLMNLFKFLSIFFLLGHLFSYWFLRILYMFCKPDLCRYFLLVCGLSFNSFNSVFWRAEAFNFEIWLLNLDYFMNRAFGVTSKKSLPKLMFSSRSFIILGFIFNVPCQVNFYKWREVWIENIFVLNVSSHVLRARI